MKIERYILSYEWREKIESCTHSGIVDRKIEDFNEFFDDIEKARERAAELEKDVKIIAEGNKTTTTYNANFRLIDRK